LLPCGGHGTSSDQPSQRERSWAAHLSRDRKASTAADKHSSGPEFARLWFSPHHGRGKCCKRMVVQAHRVAFSLGRKMQDAACELVGPHFFNAVAFERQPSLIERCFQDRERLGYLSSVWGRAPPQSEDREGAWRGGEGKPSANIAVCTGRTTARHGECGLDAPLARGGARPAVSTSCRMAR
jgi:hypothetical protein